MLKSFISFAATNKEGGITTVTLAVSSIVAVERSLSQGVVLIQGAAFTTTPQEAIRLSNELTGNGAKNVEAA